MKENRIRLFVISNMYPSKDNPGFGVFVKNIVDGLQTNGIDTPYIASIVGRGNTFVRKLWKYILFYFEIIVNYFKDYDYLYVHFPTYSSPILYVLLSIYRRKLIINYHGEDLMYFEYSKYQQLLGKLTDRIVYKFADLVIVPSFYYKEEAIRRGLVKEKSVFVSPSGGVNTSLFKKFNCLHNPSSALRIGFVGRLEPLKGLGEFLNACVSLHEKTNIHVTIIGYGPMKDTVDEFCSHNNFIHAIYGVEQRQLPKWYNQFDVLVFPSKRESLGLVGIEAMACGTPVIGTDIPGILSYLKDGENGYVVRLTNLEYDIESCILKFNSLTEIEKKEMQKRAIETSKNYSHELVCSKLACWLKCKSSQQ